MPIGEISEGEAKANAQRAAYYVAYFNNSARLTRLEKFLGGTLDWKSEYVYDGTGRLLEGTHTDADGRRTLYKFDSSGKIAKKSVLKAAEP